MTRTGGGPAVAARRQSWSALEASVRAASPFGHLPGWRLVPVIVKARPACAFGASPRVPLASECTLVCVAEAPRVCVRVCASERRGARSQADDDLRQEQFVAMLVRAAVGVAAMAPVLCD